MFTELNRKSITDCLDVVTIEKSGSSSEVVQRLNHLTALCFGKDVPLKETEERFAHSDVIQLLMHGKCVVGYAFNDHLQLAGHDVNYFSSCFVHPEHRGGVYVPFNRVRYKEIPTAVIATRTQNPRIYAGFKRFCEEEGFQLFPDPFGRVCTESLAVAQAFASDCSEDQICHSIYGRELMANTPRAQGYIVSLFETIKPECGDAMVLVGIKK